jgi:hypothetical protein
MYRATGSRRLISLWSDVQDPIEFIAPHSTLASSKLMIGLAPNTTQKEDKNRVQRSCYHST